MKMTVYLPDDLAEQMKQHDDLNVSGVLQKALRDELARRAVMVKLDKGMERVEVDAPESHGATVAFMGKEVYFDNEETVSAYLTRRHHIVVVNQDRLYQYDTFDQFAAEWQDNYPKLVAAVAAELGEKHVIELDI